MAAHRRVLGLDVSSVSCGWAVFDDDRLVAWGHLRQEGDEHGEKLANFAAWLTQMLTEHRPTHLVFEMPYPGRRRNTYGVLMLYVAEVLRLHWLHYGQEVPKVLRVPARTVKRALKVKKGKDHDENKRIMVREVNRLFDLALKWDPKDKTKRVSQDDEADAIALVHAVIELGLV